MVEEAEVKTFLIIFIIGFSLFILVWNLSMDQVWVRLEASLFSVILFCAVWSFIIYVPLHDWSPRMPFLWFLVSSLLALLERVMLHLSNVFHAPIATFLIDIGWWIFAPWIITLLSPFFAYALYYNRLKAELDGELNRGIGDSKILEIARKYGGILSLSVIVWEAKTSLEKAQKSLERFCKYGEANKRTIGSLTIYDFPSARVYLNRVDNQIVEIMRDNPYGMSRTQLLQITGLSIDSLDESLKRLESLGIIYHEMESDLYRLRGITPTTSK